MWAVPVRLAIMPLADSTVAVRPEPELGMRDLAVEPPTFEPLSTLPTESLSPRVVEALVD